MRLIDHPLLLSYSQQMEETAVTCMHKTIFPHTYMKNMCIVVDNDDCVDDCIRYF